MNLGCVVEGQGDEAALPLLLRRLHPDLVVPRPVRVPRGKMTREDEITRAVQLAASKAGEQSKVLIVLDSDDDCPVELAAQIGGWGAKRLGDEARVSVVVAVQEFEAWFLASAESLSGLRGLNDSLRAPENPEAVSDAKRWLTQNMTGSRAYKETVDQPALAAQFDLSQARERSPSFRKFCREIARLTSTS